MINGKRRRRKKKFWQQQFSCDSAPSSDYSCYHGWTLSDLPWDWNDPGWSVLPVFHP